MHAQNQRVLFVPTFALPYYRKPFFSFSLLIPFCYIHRKIKEFHREWKKKNKEAREKKGSSSAYFQLSWHTFECKVKATLGCCFKAIGVTK